MYQPQQNQAKISPGLSALMELQRTAAATTPDGSDTVAGRAMKGVQGVPGILPQGMPQGQGIASVAPNMPPVAQNAVVGAQIQQAQLQDAQKLMMEQASQQQMQNQKKPVFAQGGIAALPADNMHSMGRYAHGGVIGFAGPEGSVVPGETMTEEQQLQRAKEEIAQENKRLLSRAAMTEEQQRLQRAKEEIAQENKRLLSQAALAQLARTGTPAAAAAPAPAPAPATVGIAKTLHTPVVQTQLNRPATPTPTPAQTVPGMEMPTMARASDIDAQTTFLAPNVDTSDYEAKVSAMGKLAKEREPSTAIADLTKAEEKRKALETSRLGGYNINAIMRFANAARQNYHPGAGGAAVAEFNEEQHKLAQMNQQAEAMFDASIRREKEAAFAIRMGDAKTATELAKQSVDMRQAAQDARAKVAGNVMTAASSAYNSQMHFYSSELNNMSAERVNDALIKARAADAKLIHGDMLSKQKFINAQAAQLAKEENSPTVLPKHTLAAYAAWEAAGGPVQAALIGAGQREKAAAGAAETKIQIAAQKALSDWTLGAGAKYRKDLSTPEAKAAFKNYLSLTHNPAESEGVTGAQILGAMGNAGAAPGAGATGKVDTTGWSAKGGS